MSRHVEQEPFCDPGHPGRSLATSTPLYSLQYVASAAPQISLTSNKVRQGEGGKPPLLGRVRRTFYFFASIYILP